MSINLHNYDLVVINSSGGKDSLCALWAVCRNAKYQNYDFDNIVISHQELGIIEWPETKDIVKQQAGIFGLKIFFSKRRNSDGYEENLLEYVERRGKWPSSKQRYCTSDFKRGPGARVITALTKNLGTCKVLHVFGFRKEESPSRAKKSSIQLNKRLTTNKREVWDWLPIHEWKEEDVWNIIRTYKLPYHSAYDLGIPRLSCVFCIFSPFDALVVAGKANPELLQKYVNVENKIGHTFRDNFSIASVQDAINDSYEPSKISNWKM